MGQLFTNLHFGTVRDFVLIEILHSLEHHYQMFFSFLFQSDLDELVAFAGICRPMPLVLAGLHCFSYSLNVNVCL